ncbi:unnamed protein product [Dracunculus medinensis]|uniref:DUF2428 domain-containing protein n=1 Tax=Dracunculus medinensis TaxID=318479 RepID=A0A0N4UDS1_DRAME|nr:unnamed protein product [Dracunculus medinensis]
MILQRVCEEELLCAEELLEQGQLYRPNLHFEVFMRCIADLYDGESYELIALSSQYCSFQNKNYHLIMEELVKFIKNGKNLVSPVLHVAFLDMVKNLCRCKSSANFLFELLLSTDYSKQGIVKISLSWNHFWKAVREYLNLFATKKVHAPNIVHTIGSKTDHSQEISQTEMAGLLVWIQLSEVIAKYDSYARRQFIEHNTWQCIDTVTGLLASAIQLVLKGALLRFLASLALEGMGVPKIWIALISHSVLTENLSGKLMGIQQELEDRECSIKRYYSSLGLLHLLKEMFLHSVIIVDKQHLLPYLNFVIKSIICQCASRSYEDIDQMWELYSASCDALYSLINYYVITSTSLINDHPQIFVLRQLFSDSTFFRAMLQLGNVLIECAERLADYSVRNKKREQAALSALRLLDVCILRHDSFVDAIRSTESSIMVNSLDSLLLRPIPKRPNFAYATVIASYIIQSDLLPYHSYYAISILRELCSTRISHQLRIVRCLSPLTEKLIEGCARITSTSFKSLTVSPHDSPSPHEIDSLSISQVRGETARALLEMFISSVEIAPSSANIAYLLCGLDLTNLKETTVEGPGVIGCSKTSLHSIVETLNILATHENPLELSYAAIFEPELRFLVDFDAAEGGEGLRLVSVNAICAPAVLRFLRSNHDLIYRLASSQLFVSTDGCAEEEDSKMLINLRRFLQGSVLYLSSMELSSLLKIGHFSQPERFYRLMLCVNGHQEEMDEISESNRNLTEPSIKQGQSHLLELVITNNAKVKRNRNKIIDQLTYNLKKQWVYLLTLCTRPVSSNISQCDIHHLNWLLRRESISLAPEMQPDYLIIVLKEIEQVLRYCAAYNLRKSGEASVRLIISAWLSFLNTIAIFAPVPFISCGMHLISH